MCGFIVLIVLIATAGGAGGLSNFLLLLPPAGEKRSFLGALRFLFAGGVAAFVVPLFLSLAQSSLVKDIFNYSGTAQAYPEILVLIGFCVVAGFASRSFLDTMTNKMMQMQQEVKKVGDEARDAKKESAQAIERVELAEEGVDRVAQKTGTSAESSEEGPTNSQPAVIQLNPAALSLAQNLNPQEKEVLSAMTRYSKRTLTGVARDARLSRDVVGETIDEMRDKGVIRFTTSANTGGPRVQLTPLGTDVLNALAPKVVITENIDAKKDVEIPTQDGK